MITTTASLSISVTIAVICQRDYDDGDTRAKPTLTAEAMADVCKEIYRRIIAKLRCER